MEERGVLSSVALSRWDKTKTKTMTKTKTETKTKTKKKTTTKTKTKTKTKTRTKTKTKTKTRSVKAALGYEDYASKGTSFTSSEDPSPEGSHDSTRLRHDKDVPGFKNAGQMHKNKTKWQEGMLSKLRFKKKNLTKAVQILYYDNIFCKKVHS
jgi:hypothetical protein